MTWSLCVAVKTIWGAAVDLQRCVLDDLRGQERGTRDRHDLVGLSFARMSSSSEPVLLSAATPDRIRTCLH